MKIDKQLCLGVDMLQSQHSHGKVVVRPILVGVGPMKFV